MVKITRWLLASTVGILAAAMAAMASSSSSQLDCGTVTSLLTGCAAFVRNGADDADAEAAPSPGTPCCDGVAGLYAVAADSSDNWRAVCRCMARLVRRHSSNAFP
uniref:Bifunctional inhibitor/plant lipid transfer protein/seed storage helical domain-containing protein n=1 Tax=Leersia perrieri TaxID=77586 RepID=A0A0D9WYK9_9ORYZ